MSYKSRRDNELDIADYALEQWVEWIRDNNGYPDCSLRFEERGQTIRLHPPLPRGVAITKEVNNCIVAFQSMQRSGPKNAKDAIIVKACALTRERNITFNQLIQSPKFEIMARWLCKRGGFSEYDLKGISLSALLNARRNFAGRYSAVRFVRR